MKLAPESFALGLVIGASCASLAFLFSSDDLDRSAATPSAAGSPAVELLRDEVAAVELAPPGGTERSSPAAASTTRLDPGAGAALVSGWIERESHPRGGRDGVGC